jgi:hypothetical protein
MEESEGGGGGGGMRRGRHSPRYVQGEPTPVRQQSLQKADLLAKEILAGSASPNSQPQHGRELGHLVPRVFRMDSLMYSFCTSSSLQIPFFVRVASIEGSTHPPPMSELLANPALRNIASNTKCASLVVLR